MTTAEIKAWATEYIMNTYGDRQLALVKGEGAYVWSADGKKYLDFLSGIAVNGLGHCHPKVVSAIQNQAEKLLHVSNLYYIEPQAQLAKLLVENGDLDQCFFCNSGAEAIEAAIKLARKFSFDQGHPERTEIITMHNSFHGRTLGALSATAQKKFHTGFQPVLKGFKYVPFNNIQAVKKSISKKTCAILVEPIQGEGGVNVPSFSYLKGLKSLCKNNNILLIFDEVQTGFGRTGSLFAHELFKIKPDILTLAKALGGGMAIGAMGSTNRVMKSFAPGSHAATFGGNPLACAAALASLKVITSKGFLKKTLETGDYFFECLQNLARQHSIIKDIRGKGMMLAIELSKPGNEVVLDCMKNGFLINCIQQNILRFLPPLNISRKDINTLMPVLSKSLIRLSKKKN